ncbi:unnamed protein product [Mytilus edulis]|uniref:Uncharacterized protein n=1 Tax=Mytilus edulis TaxID=6550 RepID=A0A8S3R6Y0_MYTED|nr:unnamed protein product [Mytilus edulis]
MADQTQIPIRSSMTIDLETRISELQCASQTALRKYVAPVVSILYNSLKLSDQIDLQTHQRHLRTYGTTRFYLNYEAINRNKLSHGNRTALYDYKIQNAVDLSKLFLQTHMIHYTAFNETCDSSALLGMIINIDKFPVNVQTAASTIRSTIRNPWAHCDFTQWDSGKYNLCLQNIEAFIHLLNIGAVEKTQLIGDLNKWKTNGN